MDTHANRTGLVTGATSGLGFEAAAQLAENGYGQVIITARTESKGAEAQTRLENRTGREIFSTITLDLGDHDSVEAASSSLASRGIEIDALILNAGLAPGKKLQKTTEGLEATMAASLVGHHLFAMRLLERELLAGHARIVIAGSEAARGDVPTFTPLDVDGLAALAFGGDLEAAIEAQMRMEAPLTYHPGNTYATAKLFVAWWAAELASKLPKGMTVNAVSPGSTPDTNAIRNAPFFMKNILIPIFKFMPGMSHTVADGAGRYLEVTGYDDAATRHFYASKPKKMTGSLHKIEMEHFNNPGAQRALWQVTARVAGGVDYPVGV